MPIKFKPLLLAATLPLYLTVIQANADQVLAGRADNTAGRARRDLSGY